MSLSSGALADKVIFLTGASRGIGRSIALRAAKDGAKIVLAAKTVEKHPKLAGTIIDTANEVTQLGGHALPCAVDVRNEENVSEAIAKAVKEFGKIDILINNASAIFLTNTTSTSLKSYDLMMDINVRGTFLCSQKALPHLLKGSNPHILNLSPPLNMNAKWFSNHVAYTMSKYGMSMCVLGMHAELRRHNIAVNALWPRTAIYTAATRMLFSDNFKDRCRRPEIMADAAYGILTLPSGVPANSGNFFIDESFLRSQGVTDFDCYQYKPGTDLAIDLFIEDAPTSTGSKAITSSLTVDEVFKSFLTLRSPEVVKEINAICSFNLKGDEPQIWLVDLKTANGGIKKGVSQTDADTADCRFEMMSEDFLMLSDGQVSTADLFSSGRLVVEGDLMAAMRFDKILQKLFKV